VALAVPRPSLDVQGILNAVPATRLLGLRGMELLDEHCYFPVILLTDESERISATGNSIFNAVIAKIIRRLILRDSLETAADLSPLLPASSSSVG